MRWNLPTDGPKTLNGLIVEFLETIPEPGTTLKLADYMLEVLQTGDNAIKTVRIRPPNTHEVLALHCCSLGLGAAGSCRTM